MDALHNVEEYRPEAQRPRFLAEALHTNRSVQRKEERLWEQWGTTRPPLREQYDSWHARGPGVGPYYALRTVAKLAIWPPLLFDIRVIDAGFLLYYMLHARFVHDAICTIFAAWNKQFETLATTCCCGKNTALCMPRVVVYYTLRDEQDKSGTCKRA